MLLITQPSAIKFQGNLAIYCYNCPDCKLRLTKRVRSGKMLQTFSKLFPLEKYACEGCWRTHYLYVKKYSTDAPPRQLKYRLDILENCRHTHGDDSSRAWLIEKMYRYVAYL